MTDWERDPRPFAVLAKEFPRAMGWTRAEATAALHVPVSTYNGWCAGARTPTPEGPIRLLMQMIADKHK